MCNNVTRSERLAAALRVERDFASQPSTGRLRLCERDPISCVRIQAVCRWLTGMRNTVPRAAKKMLAVGRVEAEETRGPDQKARRGSGGSQGLICVYKLFHEPSI